MKYGCKLVLYWVLSGIIPVRAFAAQDVTEHRFDNPMTAVINATHWDRTQDEWGAGEDRDALFFDASHRFLLVRFPGSADLIHDRLSAGYTLESVHLAFRRSACPWPRAPGYAMRVFALPEREDTPEPPWRVGVWALRRPWMRDEAIGPTWNAYIQGAGWWGIGGAHCVSDRFPDPLAETVVSTGEPLGRLPIHSLFRGENNGETAAQALREAETFGFLLRRTEISHYAFGDRALSTGTVPVYIDGLVMVARFRRLETPPDVAPLPPAMDVPALASELALRGGDGFPTSHKPDNLEELVEAWRTRRRGDMPDWMWQRVQEVWNMPFYPFGRAEQRDGDPFTALMKALDSADAGRYASTVMHWELDKPPGWFRGHSHIQESLPLIACPELLPQAVRYGREISFRSRMPRGLSRPDMHHHYRVLTHTGTFNHMAQARSKAMLGAEVTGMSWLVREAWYGLIALNRKMVYTCGTSQEMGDSYYRGIALAPLQAAARFSADPLMRLKAELMMEKLLYTDIVTYHPGLRHRVSRVSRRMGGLHQFVLHQDVPEAMLHMLSRRGVLIETDKLEEGPVAYGALPIVDMHAMPPVQLALSAPWGAPWESHAIDEKTLPFRAMFKTFSLGSLDDPHHAVTYMGRHYALASEQTTGGTVPVFAAWRTGDRIVERAPEMGILMLQGRVNEMTADVLDKTPMGALQHDNKLIWIIRSPERHFLESGVNNIPSVLETGLFNLRAQAAIHAWGREGPPEVWVDGQRLDALPAAVSLDARIAVRDGVTFIGFIPLPATDLGRDREIWIDYQAPTLTIAAHVLDREEPVELTEDFWDALAGATAGWVMEIGDEAEHGSFESFLAHLDAARLTVDPDPDNRVVSIRYESGDDSMEMGFRTDFSRVHAWHEPYQIRDVFKYLRINGASPRLPEEIYMDSPLGVMGTAEMLEKGGARLWTSAGQMAFLRIEPVSAVYTGIQPFLDPAPFRLSTPEGIEVFSEGPLTLARVIVRPRENELRVDYHLPGAGHAEALRRVRENFVMTPGGEYISRPHLQAIGRLDAYESGPRPPFFPAEHIAPDEIAGRAARVLRVRGFDGPPTVILNGEPLAGPFAAFRDGNETVYRIPIVDAAGSR